MKIVINYDFFNAILDANEGLTPMKIVRNNKKTLAILSSSFFIFDYAIIRNIPKSLFLTILQSSSFFVGHYYCSRFGKFDIYKDSAKQRLSGLVSEFKNQFINTDLDLLLQAEPSEKKYKIHLNELKFPELMQYKYVLVPTYDFNGNIKNIMIEQEHVIGTDEYVLSLGSPKKELKFAFSKIK